MLVLNSCERGGRRASVGAPSSCSAEKTTIPVYEGSKCVKKSLRLCLFLALEMEDHTCLCHYHGIVHFARKIADNDGRSIKRAVKPANSAPRMGQSPAARLMHIVIVIKNKEVYQF